MQEKIREAVQGFIGKMDANFEWNSIPEHAYPAEIRREAFRVAWRLKGDRIIDKLFEKGMIEDIFAETNPQISQMAKRSRESGKIADPLRVALRKEKEGLMAPFFKTLVMDFILGKTLESYEKMAILLLSTTHLSEEAAGKLMARAEEIEDGEDIDAFVKANKSMLPSFRAVLAVVLGRVRALFIADSFVSTATAFKEAMDNEAGDIPAMDRAFSVLAMTWGALRRRARELVREKIVPAVPDLGEMGWDELCAFLINENNLSRFEDDFHKSVPKISWTDVEPVLAALVPEISPADMEHARKDAEMVASGETDPAKSFLVSFILPAIRGGEIPDPETVAADCPYSFTFISRLARGLYAGPAQTVSLADEPAEEKAPAGDFHDAGNDSPTGDDKQVPVTDDAPPAGDGEDVPVVDDAPATLTTKKPDPVLAFADECRSSARVHGWNEHLTGADMALLGNVGGLSRLLSSGRERRGHSGSGEDAEGSDDDKWHLRETLAEKNDLAALAALSSVTNDGDIDLAVINGLCGLRMAPGAAMTICERMHPVIATALILAPAMLAPEPALWEAIGILSARAGDYPFLFRPLSRLAGICAQGKTLVIERRADIIADTEKFLVQSKTSSLNYQPAEVILRSLFGNEGRFSSELCRCREDAGKAAEYAALLLDETSCEEIVDGFRLHGKTVIAAARQKLLQEMANGGRLFLRWAEWEKAWSAIRDIVESFRPEDIDDACRGRDLLLGQAEKLSRMEFPVLSKEDADAARITVSGLGFPDVTETLVLGMTENMRDEALVRALKEGRDMELAERILEQRPELDIPEHAAWKELLARLCDMADKESAKRFIFGEIDAPAFAERCAVVAWARMTDPARGVSAVLSLEPGDGFVEASAATPTPCGLKDILDGRTSLDLFREQAPNFWRACLFEGESARNVPEPWRTGDIVLVTGTGPMDETCFERLHMRLKDVENVIIVTENVVDAKILAAARNLPWKNHPLIVFSGDPSTHPFAKGLAGASIALSSLPEPRLFCAAAELLPGYEDMLAKLVSVAPEIADRIVKDKLVPGSSCDIGDFLLAVAACSAMIKDQEPAVMALLSLDENMDHGLMSKIAGPNADMLLGRGEGA